MNIIITGASKGIGYETALLFAKDKANRIVPISRSGFSPGLTSIRHIAFDLQSSSDKYSSTLLPLILKEFKFVDVLINNAGVLVNKTFEDLSPADWQYTYETNVFVSAKLIKLLLPYMSRMSHIVNISSMGAVQGSTKFKGLSAYSSSKAALANLTECLAEELKDRNIAVNCLALGAVQTEMLQQAFPDYKAPVDAKTMAEFIVEFSLNGHRYFNGKIIPVALSTP